MSPLRIAGPSGRRRAERVARVASIVFLFVAPFAASAGIRAACLIAAAVALLGFARRARIA